MPIASTRKEFVEAIRTGKTNIAKTLDKLFGTQAALSRLRNHPDFDSSAGLKSPYILSSGLNNSLPVWARDELEGHGWSGLVGAGRGLSAKELNHINKWNKEMKEKLRKKLVEAINHSRPLHFFWEVRGGDAGGTSVPPAGVGGNVTFISPRKNVKHRDSNVTVDV